MFLLCSIALSGHIQYWPCSLGVPFVCSSPDFYFQACRECQAEPESNPGFVAPVHLSENRYPKGPEKVMVLPLLTACINFNLTANIGTRVKLKSQIPRGFPEHDWPDAIVPNKQPFHYYTSLNVILRRDEA